jgi:hypothetical protein
LSCSGLGTFQAGRSGYGRAIMFLLLLLAIDERQRPCKPGMPTCLSVRYDENLGFGGDEVELLRRVRRRGRIVWLADNAVITSSRRMDQGLLRTLLVSDGYHYALPQLVSRLGGRPVIGPPPAIRNRHTDLVRRRRSWWRVAGLAAAALAALLSLAGARGRR